MTRNLFLAALCVLLMVGVASAQGFGPGDGTGECKYIDEDGDGFNDLAPDADGDGIPNGLDEDYVKPEDGSGSQHKHQYGKLGEVSDIAQGFGYAYAYMNAYKGDGPGQGEGLSHSYGPGDGTAFGPGDGTGVGVGPGDGTGFGPGEGTGDGEGTGEGTGTAARTGRR